MLASVHAPSPFSVDVHAAVSPRRNSSAPAHKFGSITSVHGDTPTDAIDVFAALSSAADVECILEDDHKTGLLAQYAQMSLTFAARCELTGRAEETRWWTKEAELWRLLLALFQQRIYDNKDARESISGFRTEREKVEHFLGSSSTMGELLVVKTWLEENHESPIPVEVRHCPVPIYTKRRLLSNIPGFVALHDAYKSSLPSSLDPDAATREGKAWSSEDVAYDDAMCRTLFEHMRRGELASAHEFCGRVGQPWRAALLSGGTYYHDPLLSSSGSNPASHDLIELDQHPSGNRNRRLWKKQIWRLSEEPSASIYERALCAALCGNIERILPVCKSWQDVLWAHLVCIIDQQIEHYLDAPQSIPQGNAEIPMVLASISNMEHDLANDLVFACVRSLISNDFALLQSRFHGLVQINRTCHHDTLYYSLELRLAMHVLLTLKTLFEGLDPDILDQMILSYCDQISHLGKTRHLAFYLSKLTSLDMQIQYAASYLARSEFDASSAYDFLRSLTEHAIAIGPIVELATQQVLQEDGLEDAFKCIDWYLYDASWFEDTLELVNLIARHLLLSKEVDSVSRLLTRLPAEMLQSGHLTSLLDSDSPLVVSHVKEFTSYQHLLHTVRVYREWNLLYSSRPDANMGVLPREADKWRPRFERATNEAEDVFRDMLTCGWLQDVVKDNACGDGRFCTAEHRRQEAAQLRSAYVAESTLNLYRILSCSIELIPRGHERLYSFQEVLKDERIGIMAELDKVDGAAEKLHDLMCQSRGVLQ